MRKLISDSQLDPNVLLDRTKDILSSVYGKRLKGVLLYGSMARGEDARTSDVDLLILLSGPVLLGVELRTIIHALYPLQLEVGRPLHAMPVDMRDFEAGDFAWLRNAKQEGVLV